MKTTTIKVHRKFWDMIAKGHKTADYRAFYVKFENLLAGRERSPEMRVIFLDLDGKELGETTAILELMEIEQIIWDIDTHVKEIDEKIQHIWFLFNRQNGYLNSALDNKGQYVALRFQTDVKVYGKEYFNGVKFTTQ